MNRKLSRMFLLAIMGPNAVTVPVIVRVVINAPDCSEASSYRTCLFYLLKQINNYIFYNR